jgi:hypothetical protein
MSGGLHEKHVVASWNLGNHLSICLKTRGNQEKKPVSRWPVVGQQKNIHASGGIRTHNRSRRVAVDLRIRLRGQWDWQYIICICLKFIWYKLII